MLVVNARLKMTVRVVGKVRVRLSDGEGEGDG